MRDLVASEWYQERWGEHVQLVRTGETSFENTAKGSREGKPFRSLTGGRGDRVLIDDPHSTETAESQAERQTTIRIFRGSVPTRLINPATSAIVVIVQRLHAEDVAGTALKLNLGYEHLMLPMEFEPDRRCHTSIGFKDPRTCDGEFLFPERFCVVLPGRCVSLNEKLDLLAPWFPGRSVRRATLRSGAARGA